MGGGSKSEFWEPQTMGDSREMIRRLRRATGEAERPGEQEVQKSREGTIQGGQHSGPQNPRVCGS